MDKKLLVVIIVTELLAHLIEHIDRTWRRTVDRGWIRNNYCLFT